MKENEAIQRQVDIIHNLHDGSIDLSKAEQLSFMVFRKTEDSLSKEEFNLVFPVLIKYFFDPAKKSKTILQEEKLSRDELLSGHRFIRESKLAKALFLSNRYPRSLLVKSATNLLDFMEQNPRYLTKILQGEMVGPMMLEIHPTNAMCIYRCQMCIWCGGQKQNTPIADFYGSEQLLTSDKWSSILEEVSTLGTKQIIFSGGGETLLSQSKVTPVLNQANSLGFETMIYTNGRTLGNANRALLESILNSNWLRVSMHAATPEIYSKLINRPLGANDLGSVLDGIKKIVDIKKRRKAKLKVGIGIVLQELNYAEVGKMARLCSDLEIDFLDIRVDCIGVTEKLSEYQYEKMLEDLRDLRSNVENGPSNFSISLADDLLIAMDKWEGIELTKPKRCLIPTVRPAIDPFGIIGACDSIGEPYTRSKSPREYVLGQLGNGRSFSENMRGFASKELGIQCKYCMPGQIALNALLEKLVDDLKIGIKPTEQPFFFNKN